ncbi:MAG: hypothetical protein J6U54_09275 [Clostridiales bacterium]|nr:hypothetical protein [Clostridiales bacterium]
MFYIGTKEKMYFVALAVLTAVNTVMNLCFSFWGSFSNIIFAGIVITWGITAVRRTANKRLRRYIAIVAGLLAIMFVIREIRYYMFPNVNVSDHLCLYAYFITTTLTPLFMYFLASFVDRPDNGKHKFLEIFFLILTFCLLMIVFTTDLHGLVYDFPHDYTIEDYKYGPLYYVILIMNFCLGIASVLKLIVKCTVVSSKKRWYIPAIAFVIGCIPIIIYYSSGGAPSLGNHKVYHFQECYSFIFILVIETLFMVGYIPSNVGYGEFFENSVISAEIFDNDKKSVYVSKGKDRLPSRSKTKSKKISGGKIVWNEDVTPVEKLKEEIMEVTENLENENDLIMQENEIRKERISYETRNRAYSRIAEATHGRAREIMHLLDDDKDSERFSKNVLHATILGVFIKRIGNLMLLSEVDQEISSEELVLSVRESLEYLKLSDIACDTISSGECKVSSKDATRAYELFEKVIEDYLGQFHTVEVNLECDGGLNMTIALDIPDAAEDGFTARYEDDTSYLSIRFEEVSV